MSFLSDVGDVLTAPARGVADLAGKAWSAVKAVISLFTALFHHVGDAWHLFWQAVSAGGTVIGHLGETVYTSVKYLVTSLIPKWASHTFHTVATWAKTAILAVERTLKALVAKVYRTLRAAVVAVERWARHAIGNVVRTLNGALHWIRTTGHQVAVLVTHPDRLVAWILPHLIFPLLRFMVGQSRPVWRWLIRGAAAESKSLAREIEEAISDLF